MFDMFGPAVGWIGIGFSEAPGVDSVSSALLSQLNISFFLLTLE